MVYIERTTRILVVLAVAALSACNVPLGDQPGDGADPNTGDGDAGAAKLAVFNDPDSEFSTSDVHDVDDEIVQFDTEADAIIWAEDGRSFFAGVWVINGNLLRGDEFFQVRFGNVDGQRRADFTETVLATICDIEATADDLRISSTNVPVPQ